MKPLFVDKYSFLTFMSVFFFVFFLSFKFDTTPAYSSYGNLLPIYSVETDEKAVSITFDVAWGCEDINEILLSLDKAGCKSTFFITGEFADKYPDAVKKIHDLGHEVANHGNNHEHFNSLDINKMKKSITECDKKIAKITGTQNNLFRAPYGEYNKPLVKLCKDIDRYIIQWSIDSLDYKNISYSSLQSRVIPKLNNGAIILFHAGTKNTAKYLPDILKEISEKGYKFKTVGNLIYKNSFTIDFSGRQFGSDIKN